jgi:FkbH-like protein
VLALQLKLGDGMKEIKCVVWDLDNTLWDGILLESDKLVLKENIKKNIQTLDQRGILNSIASKNNYQDAIEKLSHFGLVDYFLYPEINWNAKSISIGNIQKKLNISMDTILFIDDQEFEIDEVKSVHPDVNCINSKDCHNLLDKPFLNPKFITEDSVRRRLMYIDDKKRKDEEEAYQGPQETFLKSLNMTFIIQEAQEVDLKRAEELTIRTNQLNATGKTYDYDELNSFRLSDKHKLYICELIDKYGSYGKIGLALVEIKEDCWYLKLLLMSCRVMSRGIGSVLLSHIMQETKNAGKVLLADFKDTGKNRMMNVSFRLAGFKEIQSDNQGNYIFRHSLSQDIQFPDYINLKKI